jgi:signal transduction histidine kinase/ligand-binding sensor domain-containing protein
VIARWLGVAAVAGSLVVGVPARASGLHYRLFTIEDGLPTGSVRAIAQTPDGYLWIATLDGLVRFDGVRMRLFQRSDHPQMTSNRCLSLHVDRSGDLWVATEDGGVLRLRGDAVRAFGTADGLPTLGALWVEEDDQGKLYVATWAGRVVREGDRFRPAPAYKEIAPRLRPGEPPLTAAEKRVLDTALLSIRAPDFWVDRMDSAWVVTGSGSALRLTRDGFARVAWPAIAPGKRLSQTWTRVREGANGRVWLLQDGYLFRREADRWTAFPDPVPAEILPLPRDMFEDREGTLWIAGDGGLVEASATPVRALVPAGSLDRNVYTVAPDREGRVWLGTNSGPAVLDRRTEAFAAVAERSWWPRVLINTIEPEVDGSLLAGGPGGLFRIWPGRSSQCIRPELGEPRDFLRDRQGTLWVAVEGGVFRQRADGWERLEGLPSRDARTLLESQDGSLWIGTYGGLSRLSRGTLSTWTEADGLSSNRVRSLHEDASGTLWIGTYDGGIDRFAGGKLVPIRKRDGLFDDGAFAILEDDDGRFWVSSNRGVYAVHRKDLEAFAAGSLRRVACRSWTSVDGMPSSECNGGRQPSGFRADDGTLWFPTQNGIAVIDPHAVAVNTTPPLVVLEEITTDRRTLPLGRSITLAPGERRLEVRYTANTFVNPKGTRFRHRLVPFDADWVEAGDRRFAQYAYVPPGRYALDVMAANSDGVWSLAAASLAIEVRPFWWQTLWFQAAAAVLVAGLLAIAYARRVSHLKRRRSEQEAFARSLLASQEAERKRIAGELHDGIGQTLVVIRNRALLGLKDGDLVEQIAEISSAAAAGVEDVRKIAYGLRPYQIDRLGLRRALEALVEQSASSSGIPITAEIGDVDGAFAADAEINVYRIVQESLGNLARHARARSGKVAVRVENGEVTLTIEDDGVGFESSSPDGRAGMGLSGIAERARILGGRSVIRSSPGQGTTVTVFLPRSKGRDR